MPDYSVVVTWDEPCEGVAAYGPYSTEQDAKDDIANITPNFMNEGELPDDVQIRVVLMMLGIPA